MGRQSGPLRVTGSIGHLSFYHDRTHGYIVRQKGGPSAARVAKDPQFERTRENSQEFGAAAKAGKLIRQAVNRFFHLRGDSTVVPRLNGLLVKTAQLDLIHGRGKRTVANGLLQPEGRSLLSAFAFYERSPLSRILRDRVSYSTVSGQPIFHVSVSPAHLAAPSAATHASIQGLTAAFDFASGEYEGDLTPKHVVSLNEAAQDIVLSCSALPAATGVVIPFLCVVFFQERNGTLYVLEEGTTAGMVW